MRPTCINHGCDSLVVPMSGKVTDSNPRWRVHCGDCQKASYGGKEHKSGVTPFKTGKCSNTDGHLGFDCMIKWSKVPNWAKGMTEVDHIDGNSINNNISNLDELCPICHKLKGQISDDYNNTRKPKHDRINISVNKKRVNTYQQFEALFGT